MNKRIKLLTIFVVLLLATTGISFAEGSPLENDISVEQYIYSVMNTLSIEPADQEATGMEKYSKEAEVRWWIDMDTPLPLTRPLEKHEMIDMAVKAIREKGDVEYGTPSEIHEMVKDFEEVPYRSRISAVIGVNMGLVQLDENGKLSPLETVSVNEASQFLLKVKEAYSNYPNYEYLTDEKEYVMKHHGYADCLLTNTIYEEADIRDKANYAGYSWKGLHHMTDFKSYSYDDIGITFTTYFDDVDKAERNHMSSMFSIYKPGPVIYYDRENGEVIGRHLTFEMNEELTNKRCDMMRQLFKIYFPQEHFRFLSSRLELHTSQAYLADSDENTEDLLLDDMYYGFSHYKDKVFIVGSKISDTPKMYLYEAKAVEYEKQ